MNVSNDAFTVFHGSDITAEKVLASTALPELFPAVEIDGAEYWDGLFSENPPIRSLVTTDPDELWVIQVNPQEIDHVPTSTREIHDRRDELSGNLSLNQELYFIEKLNQLIDDGSLEHEGYKHIDIERIVVDEHYGYTAKLDRDRGFVEDLVEEGERDGEEFVTGRTRGEADEQFVDNHRSHDTSS
ncbi:MAG: patatin-like phospholipase family protein [Halobacteriaceae archaeon]